MHPPGFEPGITVPKTVVISISPQERNSDITLKMGKKSNFVPKMLAY